MKKKYLEPFKQLYNNSLSLAIQEPLTEENNLIIQNNLMEMRQRVMILANWITQNPLSRNIPSGPWWPPAPNLKF
jgi:hypothetical protein